VHAVATAIGAVLPPGAGANAEAYLERTNPQPGRLLVTACMVTLLAATGVMVSWMEGFRNAFRIPKTWGFWKERAVALFLVALAFTPMTFATLLVGFGSQIESWMVLHSEQTYGPYILLFWTLVRWVIAMLTSIGVLALIYHNGVPRSQPWHRVMPGAALATGMWFVVTVMFAWYVENVSTYNLIYGSLSVAIALLVWMYLLSIVILVGAEFNAIVYPRVTDESTRPTLFNRELRVPTLPKPKARKTR
jgi:membrane protein